MLFASMAGALAIAASYTSTMWLPLRNPGGEPLPPALQHTFVTAWAAMLVTTPAFCAFWFRRVSKAALHWWLSFWTVGLAVFLVHFVQAVFIFFGNDWSRILASPLVTLPRLDTLVTIWWVADVAIAWRADAEGRVVRIQRVAVHVILLALFLLGAIKEGGFPASFAAGALLGAPALISIFLRLRRSRGVRPRHAVEPLRGVRADKRA